MASAVRSPDGRFFCSECQKEHTLTVVGRGVREDGQMVLLVKTRASKIVRKAGQTGPVLIVRGVCPRCHQAVEMPAILCTEEAHE